MTFPQQNNSPDNPFTGGRTGHRAAHRATSGQARLIIALLIVLIVVVATAGAWLVWGRGDGGSGTASTGAGNGASATASTTTTGASPTDAHPDIDSVALLENAEVDSVNPPPVPDAVDAWGDYVKNRSWSGMTRVFEGQEASPVTEEDHSPFRNTMNHCGEVMYLVTFRSVNGNVLLDAQLQDAAKNVRAHAELHDGWMLGTNCELPQFAFVSSTDISNLGDVSYDVTEYRKSSVVNPASDPVPASADEQDGSSESGSIAEACLSQETGQGISCGIPQQDASMQCVMGEVLGSGEYTSRGAQGIPTPEGWMYTVQVADAQGNGHEFQCSAVRNLDGNVEYSTEQVS